MEEAFLYKKVVRCSRTGRLSYIKKSSGVPAPDDLNLTLLVVKKVLNI